MATGVAVVEVVVVVVVVAVVVAKVEIAGMMGVVAVEVTLEEMMVE